MKQDIIEMKENIKTIKFWIVFWNLSLVSYLIILLIYLIKF